MFKASLGDTVKLFRREKKVQHSKDHRVVCVTLLLRDTTVTVVTTLGDMLFLHVVRSPPSPGTLVAQPCQEAPCRC